MNTTTKSPYRVYGPAASGNYRVYGGKKPMQINKLWSFGWIDTDLLETEVSHIARLSASSQKKLLRDFPLPKQFQLDVAPKAPTKRIRKPHPTDTQRLDKIFRVVRRGNLTGIRSEFVSETRRQLDARLREYND